MAISKQTATLIILANLAMFSLVSTHAVCPDLGVCMSIANNLVNVQVGSQATSSCCQLIAGLVSANADVCMCSTLQSSLLGSLLASTLGLANGLPLIGGILGGGGGLSDILGGGGLLGGILGVGGFPPLGNLPIVGSIPLSVLNKEILVMANACGVDATKFTCTG